MKSKTSYISQIQIKKAVFSRKQSRFFSGRTFFLCLVSSRKLSGVLILLALTILFCACHPATSHLESTLLSLQSTSHSGAWQIPAIVVSTFISEDLTVIASGLLVRSGSLHWASAFWGCLLGIFLGDIGLYLIGYSASHLRFDSESSGWLAQKIRQFKKGLPNIQARMQQHGWKLLVLSRFVPGSRFIVFTAAGALGGNFYLMVVVILLAGLVWTPFLLGLSWYLGSAIFSYVDYLGGSSLLAILLTILVLYIGHQFLSSFLSRDGRINWAIRLRKLRMPEFWPPYIFYFPLPFMILFQVIRHRSITVFTAANPGILDGGFIGESKSDILHHLPREYCPDWFLVKAEEIESNSIIKQIDQKKWRYPIISKPDHSQKGIGLKLHKNRSELEKWISGFKRPARDLIIQEYHPGPFEAGIFYYRLPGQTQGRILSITDKVFARLSGDGRHTLRELILQHPRYRLQKEVFFSRNQAELDTIPPPGHKLDLGIAGNHFQGSMFLRANHWITPQLEKTIDKISKQVDSSMGGFYFGRYDIRYKNQADLKAGRNLALIELNGATAESTDMYDPALGILEIYRVMWVQLNLLYKIGAANYKRGHPKSKLRGLIKALWHYRSTRQKELVSD